MKHRDLELAHGVEVVVERRTSSCPPWKVQVVGVDASHAQRQVRELHREHVASSYELGNLRVDAGKFIEDEVLVQIEAVASRVRVRNLCGPVEARWDIGYRDAEAFETWKRVTVFIEVLVISFHIHGCLVEREFNHGSIRGTDGHCINFIDSSRARSGVETNPTVGTSF